MRLTRPFVLLALAALLAPRVEASRTSVWESNPPAAVLAKADATSALAPLADADAEIDEAPRFDLGNVVLVESELEHDARFHLGPLPLVDLNLLRGPPPSYPETRVGGFELLPPFRVGASPSLSLWSLQACGSISCGLVSDSPEDPWGLYSWGDFRKDVTDSAESYYGFLSQAALEGNPVYQLYNTVNTAKALAGRTKELYRKGGASAVADAAITDVASSLPIVNTVLNASRIGDTYENQGAFEGGRQVFRTTKAAATDVAAVYGMGKVATAAEPSMSLGAEGGLSSPSGAPGGVSIPESGGKPAWLRDVEAGNDFNRARTFDYPHRELYVEKTVGEGYWRLDGYSPGREIVSRKLTQFGKIEEATGVKYIGELRSKYPANARIAKVASTPPYLRGQRLQGQLIMEVPVQTGPIPQAVLDAARRSGVLIRDVFGKVY